MHNEFSATAQGAGVMVGASRDVGATRHNEQPTRLRRIVGASAAVISLALAGALGGAAPAMAEDYNVVEVCALGGSPCMKSYNFAATWDWATEAVDPAYGAGFTATLLKDAEYPGKMVISGQKITVVTNGHSLLVNTPNTIYSDWALTVKDNAVLALDARAGGAVNVRGPNGINAGENTDVAVSSVLATWSSGPSIIKAAAGAHVAVAKPLTGSGTVNTTGLGAQVRLPSIATKGHIQLWPHGGSITVNGDVQADSLDIDSVISNTASVVTINGNVTVNDGDIRAGWVAPAKVVIHGNWTSGQCARGALILKYSPGAACISAALGGQVEIDGDLVVNPKAGNIWALHAWDGGTIRVGSATGIYRTIGLDKNLYGPGEWGYPAWWTPAGVAFDAATPQYVTTVEGKQYVTYSDGESYIRVRGTLTAAVPTVSGSAKVGKTVTAKAGTWTSGTAHAYQWLRNGAVIAGATKSTYTLGAADKGKKVSVKVTGTKAGHNSVTKMSASTAAVAAGSFTVSAKPKIRGTSKVGRTLTAVNPKVSPTPTTVKYRWYVGGTKVTGAKGVRSTYKVRKADKGKKITVKVTVSKAGYASKTVKPLTPRRAR
ncbi:MAG: hypothetical protein LBH13_05680 [Cellulomonadaceae bacterium]|nr:hypothetical protein [Cellulomonadaceae bacterium]